ncbi:MAG: amidohydrolase family protein [Gemmatales bacterium]|nr:amidohydrolase family protein [Gemmatales bacterium]MDW8387767.1 amidohydrolase family protein [Gemmatales bacterium]
MGLPRGGFPALLLWTCLLGLSAADKQPDEKPLALVGGLIRTQTEAGDFVGCLVVDKGRIVALGPDVQPPGNARVVNVSGCVITPGLVDARGVVGLNPSAASEGGRDGTLDILDAVDPYADDWRTAARHGVTAVAVQPAGSGNLGGSGAVLRIAPAETPTDLVIRSPAAVQACLGIAPRAETPATSPLLDLLRSRGFQIPVQPQQPAAPPPATTLTRYAQYEQLRGQFDAAKRYAENPPARKDRARELLAEAIRGRIPVRMEVHYEDDVRNALRLAADFNLRMVFERVERCRVIPEELSKSRCGLVIGPLWPERPSIAIRDLVLGSSGGREGVGEARKFAIGTYGSDPQSTAALRFHAASAVTAGYPRNRVLSALTSEAADLLGVGDKLGRLAVGRVADLAVFAGDPLDPSAPVRLAISQGRITHENWEAEAAETPRLVGTSTPDKLPNRFTLRTRRLLAPDGTWKEGALHVSDGRFVAESQLAGDNSVVTIDLGDLAVTPGLVSGHFPLTAEQTPDADASHLRAADLLFAEQPRLRSQREAGMLWAVIAPGSANVLAGVVTLTPTDGPTSDAGKTPAITERAPRDIAFKGVLTASARNRDRYPASLAGQYGLLSDRIRGMNSETRLYLPDPIRQALLAERERRLDLVRSRAWPMLIEAQTRAEIEAALRLAEQFRIRILLVNPRDVDGLGEVLRSATVGVVLAPTRPTDAERTVQALSRLASVGVPLALGGDAVEMRTTAAVLAAAGTPRAAARRALIAADVETLAPTAAASRIAPGSPADLVIWSGDPLDLTSRPVAVIVEGKRVAGSAP